MVDPVIDEHFRRSLGADYMSLFNKKQEQPLNVLQNKNTKNSSESNLPQISANNSITGQAISNKWVTSPSPSSPSSSSSSSTPSLALSSIPVKFRTMNGNESSQKADEHMETSDDSTTSVEMSVDDHFAKALGDTWAKLQKAEKSSNTTNTTNKTTSNDKLDVEKVKDKKGRRANEHDGGINKDDNANGNDDVDDVDEEDDEDFNSDNDNDVDYDKDSSE